MGPPPSIRVTISVFEAGILFHRGGVGEMDRIVGVQKPIHPLVPIIGRLDDEAVHAPAIGSELLKNDRQLIRHPFAIDDRIVVIQ